MKKVLHVITGLELGGGAENMLLQLLPKMQGDLDNRVCVIKGRGEIGKKLEEQGIVVYYLDLKSIFDLGIIFRYRNVLKEFQPDVQINYLIHADIFGRIFGKIFGVKKIVPYIRNIHRSRKFLMFLDKLILPLADFILTNSKTAKKYYIDKMGVKADKIMCIPNGIDLSRFENLNVNISAKKKEIGIAQNSFVIGTVARLEKQKDIPTLIKAFKIIQERYSLAHLLLVGHGSQKENIKKLIEDLSLKDKVTMLEKRTDNLELISIMDIFILPSLNEGMSNALLEAMTLKKLIITSDIEENSELIANKINGLNFSPGNQADLSQKILSYLNAGFDSSNYQNNNLAVIKNTYNLNLIAHKYKEFLINFNY
jgi:glycosyltransferase involved in cell wall biosynthesis